MLFFKFYIHTYRNGLPMTPGDGVSIQCWGTEVLLELRRSSPCQHVYSENKVDSPFIQSRSVFQKHWKDVAKSNSALGQMSGTMLNCTPPPNTGYMEVKLLWWHGWALVKLRIHSRSRHLISAYWTVQPGTKFLNLVCLHPFLKKRLSYTRALQTIFFRKTELKVQNSISLYQPPIYLSLQWTIVTASLSKAKRCLPAWHGLFPWSFGHLPGDPMAILLRCHQRERTSTCASTVPCGRRGICVNWFVWTNYQLEGALRKFFSSMCKPSKRWSGHSWSLRLSLWLDSVHPTYRWHSAQGQITYQ